MIPSERGMGIRSAKRLTIVVGIALLISLLGGCGPEPPAPTPTLNPHAHETATILVSVNDAHVDNVKVVSTWQLGNFKCAPIIGPEGYLKMHPVSVDEEVTRLGNDYKASISLDRFKHDKCNWFLAVNGIKFMNNGEMYAMYAFDIDKLDTGHSQKIVCMPSPIGGGVCAHRRLNSAEKRIQHKFDATVEYVP